MSERARRLAPLLLVIALAIAWQLPAGDWLRLSDPDPEDPERMTAALDALGDEPRVLVGFDADIGTYAEIRPTVRSLIADLLAREGRLAFVSLTAEGRALGSAELARMGRGEANPTRLLDLGFIPGAEAGLVDLTRAIRFGGAVDSAFAREVDAGGIGTFDAVLVIGGNDLGARSWIEQVAPRIGAVPFLAVTPTVLLPEVQPYLASGALRAVIATPRDGAAYRETIDLGNLARLADPIEPRPLPLLVGMLVAVGVLGQGLGARARLPARLQVAGAGMSGFFGTTTADLVATWVAAIVTLVVFGALLGERRAFGWTQHLLAGLATGFLALIALTELIGPRLIEPIVADPSARPELWIGVALVATAAAAPWLPKRVSVIPVSIAIGALAAFALGGAVIGTLLPQIDASIVRPGGSAAATLGGALAVMVTGLVLVGFLHGMPRGRLLTTAAGAGRWLLIAGIGGWLGFLILSRLILLVDRIGFLLGDWLGLVP